MDGDLDSIIFELESYYVSMKRDVYKAPQVICINTELDKKLHSENLKEKVFLPAPKKLYEKDYEEVIDDKKYGNKEGQTIFNKNTKGLHCIQKEDGMTNDYEEAVDSNGSLGTTDFIADYVYLKAPCEDNRGNSHRGIVQETQNFLSRDNVDGNDYEDGATTNWSGFVPKSFIEPKTESEPETANDYDLANSSCETFTKKSITQSSVKRKARDVFMANIPPPPPLPIKQKFSERIIEKPLDNNNNRTSHSRVNVQLCESSIESSGSAERPLPHLIGNPKLPCKQRQYKGGKNKKTMTQASRVLTTSKITFERAMMSLENVNVTLKAESPKISSKSNRKCNEGEMQQCLEEISSSGDEESLRDSEVLLETLLREIADTTADLEVDEEIMCDVVETSDSDDCLNQQCLGDSTQDCLDEESLDNTDYFSESSPSSSDFSAGSDVSNTYSSSTKHIQPYDVMESQHIDQDFVGNTLELKFNDSEDENIQKLLDKLNSIQSAEGGNSSSDYKRALVTAFSESKIWSSDEMEECNTILHKDGRFDIFDSPSHCDSQKIRTPKNRRRNTTCGKITHHRGRRDHRPLSRLQLHELKRRNRHLKAFSMTSAYPNKDLAWRNSNFLRKKCWTNTQLFHPFWQECMYLVQRREEKKHQKQFHEFNNKRLSRACSGKVALKEEEEESHSLASPSETDDMISIFKYFW